ncbi:hypothetical protein SAMN05660903_03749 [Salegentibacter salinarum]|nr:hypothetical protein [Salegentibacter salinarum]SKC00208.1 hypothetical protein SAMN05660903_03749 [Salegentibacter salinarum]
MLATLFCCIHVNCQEEEQYDLRIFFTNYKNYKIAYQKSEKNTQIIIHKEISRTNISNSDYLKMKKIVTEEENDGLRKLIQIGENYREYETDTLIIKNGSSIVEIVDNFVENWERNKSHQESYPENRLILDGYGLIIFLKKNNITYESISVRTPTAQSHPEIFELYSKIESFYKKNAKKPVIE